MNYTIGGLAPQGCGNGEVFWRKTALSQAEKLRR